MQREHNYGWFKYNKLAYFTSSQPVTQPAITNKWELLRGVAKDLKLRGESLLRLEWIIFYHTVGKKNISTTAKHFTISRKTLHKWLQRFQEANLRTLEEESRRPHTYRKWEVTEEQEDRIKTLRTKHMRYGKEKLRRLYKKRYKEEISTWKIERVIRAYKLYQNKKKHILIQKKKARSATKPKKRIQQIQKAATFGHLWHIDSIIINWYGHRRVLITALEEQTKIAYARLYPTNTSRFASDFLKRLTYLIDAQITIIHSDNGAEFAGLFEKACKELGIEQVYSRPHQPKDNAALERFNRTIQEEWLEESTVGLDEIHEANKELITWLIEYNAYRPHKTLDYMTPLEYAEKKFFPDVLPMWSASTDS